MGPCRCAAREVVQGGRRAFSDLNTGAKIFGPDLPETTLGTWRKRGASRL